MADQSLRRADELLTELVEQVETARSMPMSSSCVLPRERMLDLLDELREVLPSEIEEARKVTAAVSAFGRGPVPVLVDMRHLAKAERAAREHFTGPEAQATAVALLIDSAVSKVVANFMIGLQRMPVPTRMFNDEAAAVSWLEGHSG